MPRAKPQRRTRTKDGLAVIKAVERAGGSVIITSKGHLRVTGPTGIAIVASAPANNSMQETVQTIRKYAGLEIEL